MATFFTKEHEYISVEGDTGTVGISDYAQGQLGDVVFVELPSIGKELKQGDDSAVVESVKAAGEVYAPVSGVVTGVNNELEGAPGLVNEDPTGKGWFYRLQIVEPKQLEELMNEEAYAAFVASIS